MNPMILVTATAGDHLSKFSEQVVHISKTLKQMVYMEFNSTQIKVHPTMGADEVCDLWNKAREAHLRGDT